MPQHSLGLDQANAAYDGALADTRIAGLAQPELREAREILDRATIARATLDDIAEVDHLAYIAKQRVAIGREAAVLRGLASASAQ